MVSVVPRNADVYGWWSWEKQQNKEEEKTVTTYSPVTPNSIIKCI